MSINRAEVTFGTGALSQEIHVGKHVFRGDVGLSEGGEDQGPTPHDFLAAALGTCTGLTLRMYAKRKSWPLQDVKTTVTVELRGDTTYFERSIQITGALDDAQKSRLVEIANACPIHKVLKGKIAVNTRLD